MANDYKSWGSTEEFGTSLFEIVLEKLYYSMLFTGLERQTNLDCITCFHQSLQAKDGTWRLILQFTIVLTIKALSATSMVTLSSIFSIVI